MTILITAMGEDFMTQANQASANPGPITYPPVEALAMAADSVTLDIIGENQLEEVLHDGPTQSAGEELANTLSHGLGALMSLIGMGLMIAKALTASNTVEVVSATLFGAALTTLYLTSAVYHGLPNGKLKHLFRNGDHMAIYVLIAGSYTVVALTSLEGATGWALFGIQWALAIVGIAFKAKFGFRFHLLSTLGYLVMGWMATPVIMELWENIPGPGFAWLVAGGLAYTLGVPFFLLDQKIRYFHSIWHLFVLAGSTCHFVMAYFYLL